LRVGDEVNLESDVLGRYARRAEELPPPEADAASAEGGLTMDMLMENGFA
jgi:riboflavin synthase alpha subunit